MTVHCTQMRSNLTSQLRLTLSPSLWHQSFTYTQSEDPYEITFLSFPPPPNCFLLLWVVGSATLFQAPQWNTPQNPPKITRIRSSGVWAPMSPHQTIRIKLGQDTIPPPLLLVELGTSWCRRRSFRSRGPRVSRFRQGLVRPRFWSPLCFSPTWRYGIFGLLVQNEVCEWKRKRLWNLRRGEVLILFYFLVGCWENKRLIKFGNGMFYSIISVKLRTLSWPGLVNQSPFNVTYQKFVLFTLIFLGMLSNQT